MISPLVGGAGIRGGMNLTINIGTGGGAGTATPVGMGAGCPHCGDGFSPSSELLQGGGLGSNAPFGPSGADGFAALLAQLSGPGAGGLGTAHPWASGISGGGGIPPAMLGGDAGAFPPALLGGGGGSLADQALMMQAASSDMNQAALIGAQTGAMGGLAGAQGTALAGINPLMSGLMSNYG